MATISASNLIVDSSLSDTIANWDETDGGYWYYSPGVSYLGVQSIGYNKTGLSGNYSRIISQVFTNNSFSGSTLNVSVDVRTPTIGSDSTDYLIVYLDEYDESGNTVVSTNITGTLRTSNGSWVNYRKKITVGTTSRKFYLRYQMRGNGNVYIARPYVGVQELIPGGYTAGTNNNNQTILSLFKDNWSIGIADNITNITNGIVGTPSNLSVISKNVTIDSPQTQITGHAWIKSADIANGAIGNAQIGDASISSAKIANLDASKISGGTISGVDFLVDKSMTIASGGSIHSDVVNMGKSSFEVSASNVGVQRYSATGYKVVVYGTYTIDSILGSMGTAGTISVTRPNETTPYRKGASYSSYGVNNINLTAENYDDGSLNEYANFSSASIDMITGGSGGFISNAKNYTRVTAEAIIMTGTISAGDTIHTDGILSTNNITIDSAHNLTMLDNQDFWLKGDNGKPVGMHGKAWSNSSLRSMKEHFSNVDPKYALDELLKTDIKSYNFIGDEITDNYVSPIIDDTEGEFYIPKDFLDSTGKGVKTYSIDGYLIQAIKALQEQITELKQG